MLKCLECMNWKKFSGLRGMAFCLEPPELKFLEARTRKRFT